MNDKRAMLILLAAGTAAGKGALISKIKRNKLFSAKNVCQIGTDDYVTIRIKEESRIGEIVYGFGGTGWSGGISGESEFNNHLKKEINENLQVQMKLQREWHRPENVNAQALKQKIHDELNDCSNKIIIVEGVHALQFADIRELADLKIWIQNDDDLRLIRKITRGTYYKKMVGEIPEDPRSFGGTLCPFPYAFKCWTDETRREEKTHVLPTKKHADLTVYSNDWTQFNQGVEKIISIINLYFRDEEDFKRQLTNEKRRIIESEITGLREELQEKERELFQLTKQNDSDQCQEIIQQQHSFKQ